MSWENGQCVPSGDNVQEYIWGLGQFGATSEEMSWQTNYGHILLVSRHFGNLNNEITDHVNPMCSPSAVTDIKTAHTHSDL